MNPLKSWLEEDGWRSGQMRVIPGQQPDQFSYVVDLVVMDRIDGTHYQGISLDFDTAIIEALDRFKENVCTTT